MPASPCVRLTHCCPDLFGQAVDALVSNREYAQALALIDSGCAGPIAPPDYLLLALAEKQPKTSPRYLVRLRDKKVWTQRPDNDVLPRQNGRTGAASHPVASSPSFV